MIHSCSPRLGYLFSHYCWGYPLGVPIDFHKISTNHNKSPVISSLPAWKYWTFGNSMAFPMAPWLGGFTPSAAPLGRVESFQAAKVLIVHWPQWLLRLDRIGWFIGIAPRYEATAQWFYAFHGECEFPIQWKHGGTSFQTNLRKDLRYRGRNHIWCLNH